MSKCIKTQRLHKGVISSITVIGGQVLGSEEESGEGAEEKEAEGEQGEGKVGKESALVEEKVAASSEKRRRKASMSSSTTTTTTTTGGVSDNEPKREKMRSLERLLVAGDDFFESWKISRDLKFDEYKGHSDPIVAVIAMDGEQDEYGAGDAASGSGGGGGGFGGGLAGLASSASSGSQDQSHASLENNIIFSASLDNTIKCWDCYEGTCLYTLKETATEISCMRYLHNCDLLVTGNDDGSVRWWNPASGSTITLRSHTNTVSCMAVAKLKRNDYLLSAGYAGNVCVWDITKKRSIKPRLEYMFQAHEGEDVPDVIFGGTRKVNTEILCICFAPAVSLSMGGAGAEAQDVFLTGGNDTTIKVWSMGTYALQAVMCGHTDAVTCMTLDANFAFSGSDDRTIRIWNIANVKAPYELAVLKAHTVSVRDVLIIPSTGWLVSCAFDGHLKVWDYSYDAESDQTGRVVKDFQHNVKFRCLAYRQRKREILCGTEENSLLAFHLPDKVEV